MSLLTLSAKLDRSDGNTSWGFRMFGGKDFGAPLSIQKVTPGSLAQKCGLMEGDVITKIGDAPTEYMRHKEAQQKIIMSGNSLELALERGGRGGRGPPAGFVPNPVQAPQSYAPPPAPGANYGQGTTNGWTSRKAAQSYNEDYNRAAAPFSPGGTPMSQAHVPVAVNKQYNTPINMYSMDNVMDSLVAQTSAIAVGPTTGGGGGGRDAIPPWQREGARPPSDPGFSYGTGSYSYTPKSPGMVRKSSPSGHAYSPKSPGLRRKGSYTQAYPPKSPGSSRKRMSASPVRTRRASGSPVRKEPPSSPVLVRREPFSGSTTTRQQPAPPSSYQTVTFNPAPNPALVPFNPSVPTKKYASVRFNPSKGRVVENAAPEYQSQPVVPPEAVVAPPPAAPVPQPEEKIVAFHAEPEPVPEPVPQAPPAPAPAPAPGPAPETVPAPAPEPAPAPAPEVAPKPAPVTAPKPAPVTAPKPAPVTAPKPAPVTAPKPAPVTAPKPPKPPKPAGGPRAPVQPPAQQKLCVSETMRMVHQEDREQRASGGSSPPPPENLELQTVHAKTFEKRSGGGGVGGGGAAPSPRMAPVAPPAPPPPVSGGSGTVVGGVWKPKLPTGPRKMRSARPGEAKHMPAMTTGRIPVCSGCGTTIRGPFVAALDKQWCPDHFICSNPQCRCPLIGVGFVEEEGQLFCERDYEQYFAPRCGKCGQAIMRECVNALKETFHPSCFVCLQCGQTVGQGAFHLEDGQIFCEKDWQSRFQTKCYGCQFPIEPGDRWVEALNQNWHSECFNCSTCQVNLEGQSFFAKGGKPYCKKHASSKQF